MADQGSPGSGSQAATAFLEVWAPGRHTVVALGTRLTIGRSAANDVAMPNDKTVSALHAAIEPIADRWCVEDLGSRNGTFVGGDRLQSRRALRDGDELVIGQAKLVFHVGTDTTVSLTQGAAPPPVLTPREHEVLRELCRPLLDEREGYSEPTSLRDLARALHVSEAAIEHHLLRLYEKFEIASGSGTRRGRLAHEALRRRVVTKADLGHTR